MFSFDIIMLVFGRVKIFLCSLMWSISRSMFFNMDPKCHSKFLRQKLDNVNKHNWRHFKLTSIVVWISLCLNHWDWITIDKARWLIFWIKLFLVLSSISWNKFLPYEFWSSIWSQIKANRIHQSSLTTCNIKSSFLTSLNKPSYNHCTYSPSTCSIQFVIAR